MTETAATPVAPHRALHIAVRALQAVAWWIAALTASTAALYPWVGPLHARMERVALSPLALWTTVAVLLLVALGAVLARRGRASGPLLALVAACAGWASGARVAPGLLFAFAALLALPIALVAAHAWRRRGAIPQADRG